MSELPTDLDTLLEAVEAMMGTEFADKLTQEIWVSQRVFKWTPEKIKLTL
jgi:hypothetical protein